MDKTLFEQAKDLVKRAGARYCLAKEQFDKGIYSYYPEAIAACIDSMELAAKAVCLCLVGEYPEAHDLGNKKHAKLLERLRDAWRFDSYPPRKDLARLLNYSSFWSEFYTRSKYGFEELRVGAAELFDKQDVELALRHAQACNLLARYILEWARGLVNKA